jgi:RpiR family transcriptional regulator, carbohydrate utilization regulator
MPLNCLGTIRSSYHKFSEKEKKIADYILEKPELVIHRTINEVADDLNIADATVFRFSKHIGFKGFQALKIALASEITTPSRTIHEEKIDRDSQKTLTEKIFKSNIRTLQNTIQMIDGNSIKKAIDLILHANRVEFYGTGNSAIIAIDAFRKFVSTGIRAFGFIDTHFQLMSASQLTKDDLAIFISHSGSNVDTMKILKFVNETGAKTIGITSDPKSPISLNVDLALYTDSEETEYFSAAFSSQIAQLSLIDAICLNIINLKQSETAISPQK